MTRKLAGILFAVACLPSTSAWAAGPDLVADAKDLQEKIDKLSADFEKAKAGMLPPGTLDADIAVVAAARARLIADASAGGGAAPAPSAAAPAKTANLSVSPPAAAPVKAASVVAPPPVAAVQPPAQAPVLIAAAGVTGLSADGATPAEGQGDAQPQPKGTPQQKKASESKKDDPKNNCLSKASADSGRGYCLVTGPMLIPFRAELTGKKDVLGGISADVFVGISNPGSEFFPTILAYAGYLTTFNATNGNSSNGNDGALDFGIGVAFPFQTGIAEKSGQVGHVGAVLGWDVTSGNNKFAFNGKPYLSVFTGLSF